MHGKFTYFLSDLHLGARYIPDRHEHEMRIVNWLDSIKDSAESIYLLGDILDYWFEYRCVVPRGFVRFLGKLAELSDMGIHIFWMTGNHDIWIFDYLPQELGIKVIDGPIVTTIHGKKFLLDHGDNVGKKKPAYAIMRSIFHNKLCQWLYASIHPRWTIPFATGWSKSNRVNRKESDITKKIKYGMKSLTEFSESYSLQHPDVDYFIYGHLHTLSDTTLHTGSRMIVLGEWIKTFSFATFDGTQLSLHTLKREVTPPQEFTTLELKSV